MTCPAQLDVCLPGGRRSVFVRANQLHQLTEVLRQNQLSLNTRCGNRGLCDGCLVELLDGQLVELAADATLSSETRPVRLRACQYGLAVGGRAEIRVPARSLLAHQPQIVTSFRIRVARAHDPLWQRVAIDCDQLDASQPWRDSICHAVTQKYALTTALVADDSIPAPSEIEGAELSMAIRHEAGRACLGVVQLAPSQRAYGVAIDLGTTTVAVLLVDLASGEIVAESSALNAQADLGDNVVTRINLCMMDNQMVGRLQQAVIQKTIAPLIDDVLCEIDVSADQLVCMAVAGNATMLHLLSGVDPTSMGLAPFTPSFLSHRVVFAQQLPWGSVTDAGDPAPDVSNLADQVATTGYAPGVTDPPVHLLPGADAYLGADVVAGVLSTGMAYETETCMLIDIGTNGEIVLKHGARLLACATAAGPAFEGSGLSCGVRAGKGAICHVRITQDPPRLEYDVIGGGKAIGLCGTAYVDLIAQARKLGLIGHTGRFVNGAIDEWPLTQLPQGRGLTIAHGRDRDSIHVTEGDIATLLQAKAAIAAGIICLLDRANLRSEDVATLYLAGGFGFHMDVEHAIALGLLPGFQPSQVQLIGNSALAGAYLALLDSGSLGEASQIASSIETVELNLEPQFESRFIDQLLI